ncbi:hypothetical protein BCD64_20845 [Nostoc sp. MBR 210]|nr:hypothetical protein BCD64_20845 [Nostoc sp. MBR 210]
MLIWSGSGIAYSGSYLLVIQSEPHPAFANANAGWGWTEMNFWLSPLERTCAMRLGIDSKAG